MLQDFEKYFKIFIHSVYVFHICTMDKAGAYGIQGYFAAWVSGISGDYNNVVGLPVGRVYRTIVSALEGNVDSQC